MTLDLWYFRYNIRSMVYERKKLMLEFIKIKNFFAKDTVKIIKIQVTDWEKMFANYLIKHLYPTCTKKEKEKKTLKTQ